MIQQPPADYLPEWVVPLLSAVLGAGGVRFLSVWLENRRLTTKEYRETLLGRITVLEQTQGFLQQRIGNLRVEVAYLESENKELRKVSGLPPRPLKELKEEQDE